MTGPGRTPQSPSSGRASEFWTPTKLATGRLKEVDASRLLLPWRQAISELPFAAAHVRSARQLAGEVVGVLPRRRGTVEPSRQPAPAAKGITDHVGLLVYGIEVQTPARCGNAMTMQDR